MMSNTNNLKSGGSYSIIGTDLLFLGIKVVWFMRGRIKTRASYQHTRLIFS